MRLPHSDYVNRATMLGHDYTVTAYASPRSLNTPHILTTPDRCKDSKAQVKQGIAAQHRRNFGLEDAVAPEDKSAARENVRAWLRAGHRAIVRINDPCSPWYQSDVAALTDSPCTVMVPKSTSPAQLNLLIDRLAPDSSLIPLLETAAGVLNAASLCAAPRVARVAFGNGDLAAELGIDHSDQGALTYARCAIVLASAAARIRAPLDGVTTAIGDEQLLDADLRHAISLGFAGKLCIHPGQVHVVNAAFTTSDAALQWALRVLDATSEGSVTTLDGELADGSRPTTIDPTLTG